MNRQVFRLASLALAGLLPGYAFSQTAYVISGRATDAATGDPIPFASVALKGRNIGTNTNFDGFYTLKTTVLTDSIQVVYVGYTTKTRPLNPKLATQTVNFQLASSEVKLREVVVNSGENPAFRILRGVRNNLEKNDKKRLNAYEYETYSKVEVDVDNLSEEFRKRRIVRKITKVIDEFEKIAGEDGKPVLPMFLSESISNVYFRDAPARKKELILKTKVTGVGVKDGSFVSQLIGNNFQDFNFYNNYVSILQKDFASPIGDGWKGTYQYFLGDSLDVEGHFCYEIEYEPKRAQDLAFAGKIWVDKATFALVRINAEIGKAANLNYIDKIRIQQELEQTSEGAWLPARNRFLVDIAELNKNSAGMLAKFYVSNRNFVVNRPRPLAFYDQPIEVAEDFKDHNAKFWEGARHDSLSPEDKRAYQMIDSVKNIPVVRTYVEIINILVNGYKRVGKVDIGPYIYALAPNRIEGLRVRLGFRTNDHFSKHWILRGYAGVGTRDFDKRFKFSAEVNYLVDRHHWTVLGARYSQDIERVGLTSDMLADNKLFLASTRWGSLRGSYWQREVHLFAQREFTKGVTQSIAFRTQSFDPLYRFEFRTQPEMGQGSPLRKSYQSTEIIFETRFSKGETFIQDGNERITIGTKRLPVVTLRYVRGFQGILGGEFDYHRFSVNAFQTLRLGALGRSSYRLSVGYTPNTLPYPLLFPHLGNETFLYNRFAFNMMNYFEFVSDRYASLQWQHNFEGLLFNRIPLIKKLKWRFVAVANVLYGAKRQSNKDIVPDTETMPDGTKRRVLEFGSLDPDLPYVEVGYGIDNIFKIFRIQALHRLTYLDRRSPSSLPPSRFAIKASVHFQF